MQGAFTEGLDAPLTAAGFSAPAPLPFLDLQVGFPVLHPACYTVCCSGEPHSSFAEVTKLMTVSLATWSLLFNSQLDMQVSVIKQLRG